MIKYLKNISEKFLEHIKTIHGSCATDHIFTVHKNNNRKLLPEEQAQHLQLTVAQIIFLRMRACPGIQKEVAFLIKRVRTPDEDNSGKHKRVFQYLKGIMYMKLVLSM